jgi:hypothetical protein
MDRDSVEEMAEQRRGQNPEVNAWRLGDGEGNRTLILSSGPEGEE